MLISHLAIRRSVSQFCNSLLLLLWLIAQIGCSNGATANQGNRLARSVAELAATDDVVVYLQEACGTLARKKYETPREQEAIAKASRLIEAAIRSLEQETALEPPAEWPKERQLEAQRLLGIWRYRVNADGHENLLIYGPDRTLVGIYGGYQIMLAEWECRDKALYWQNEIDMSEQRFDGYWSPPSTFEIAPRDDGAIDLKPLDPNLGDSHAGYTLTRIH